MSRKTSLKACLSQFKSRFFGHRCQKVNTNRYISSALPSYSSDVHRKTFYNSDVLSSSSSSSLSSLSLLEQHDNIDRLNEKSEDVEQIHNGTVERIYSKNFPESFEFLYEIYHGFTSEQQSLIQNALQIVADRLFKSEILNNMYQVCGTSGCFVPDEILSRSNLLQSSIYFNRYLILHYHLRCLKIRSQTGEMPLINIHPIRKNKKGKTNHSHPSVLCVSHGSTFLTDGEFEIELDQDKLNGSVKNDANALFWAGEIVCQMLCNLGHRSNENTHPWHRSQINVFKQCFLYDGCYIPLQHK